MLVVRAGWVPHPRPRPAAHGRRANRRVTVGGRHSIATPAKSVEIRRSQRAHRGAAVRPGGRSVGRPAGRRRRVRPPAPPPHAATAAVRSHRCRRRRGRDRRRDRRRDAPAAAARKALTDIDYCPVRANTKIDHLARNNCSAVAKAKVPCVRACLRAAGHVRATDVRTPVCVCVRAAPTPDNGHQLAPTQCTPLAG